MKVGRCGVGALVAALLITGCGDDSASGGAGAAGGAGGAGGAPGGAGGAGGGGASVALVWEPCLDAADLECTELSVPIDHDDESLGTAHVRLVRPPPLEAPKGTVFVLSGDAGDSVSASVGEAGLVLRALGWNSVGMDHRGLDLSSPVLCGDDDSIEALWAMDTSPDTAEERAALDEVASAWVEACHQNTDPALLPRVDSRSAAQDLELARAALGVEEVNVFAGNHGSRIALRYAALHPERLRAVVLDSPDSPSLELEDAIRDEAIGFQEALERFFAFCSAGCGGATPCFGDGGGVEEIRAAFDAAHGTIEALNVGRLADRVVYQLLGYARFADLASALVGLEGGTADELLSHAQYPPMHPDGQRLWNYMGARTGIWNADHVTPPGYTSADFDSFVAELSATVAPQAAWFVSTDAPYWHIGHYDVVPARAPAPYAAPDAPPMLILAGTFNPEAPLADVLALQEELGNGSFVVVRDGDGKQQIYDDCMRGIALDFLDDPSAPSALSCE